MKIATAYVEIRPDTAGFERDVTAKAKSLGSTFAQVFGAAAFGAGLKRSIDAASRLEQAVGATSTVFKASSKAVDDFAKTSAKAFGISESAARELTSSIGALLKNMGYTEEQAAATAVQLAKLGADLAAAFGGNPEEAVQALGAALRGEMDPVERFGIKLNDAKVKAKAFEMGLYSGKGALDENAKAQASLALIMQQTADVQGQATREANTAAGAQARAAAMAEDSAASLGENFLPIYTKVVELVGMTAEAFGKLPGPIQTALVALVGLVALSGPIRTVTGVMGQLATKIRGLSDTTKSAGAGLGVFAATAMVAFTIRGKQAADAAGRIADGIAEISRASDAAAVKVFLDTLADMVIHGQHAGDALDYLAQQNLEGAKRILALGAASGLAADGLALLQAAVDREEAARAQAVVTGEKYSGTLTDTTDKTDTAAEASDDLARSLKKTSDQFNIATEAADALKNAFDAVFGPAMNMEEATRASYDAAVDLTAAVKENGATLDENTNAGRRNREAVQNSVQSILDYATASIAAGKSADEVAMGVAVQTAALEDQLRALGFSQEAIDAYLTSLGLTPENVNTTITIAQADAEKAKIDDLLKQLGDIDAGAEAEITALVDQGKYDEAEAKIAKLAADKGIKLKVSVSGGGTITVGAPVNARYPVRAYARGGYTGNAAHLAQLHPNEGVLPLDKPSRIRELIGDPRIGGPIAAALGGGSGGSGAAALSGDVRRGGDTFMLIGWDERMLRDLQSRLDARRKGTR